MASAHSLASMAPAGRRCYRRERGFPIAAHPRLYTPLALAAAMATTWPLSTMAQPAEAADGEIQRIEIIGTSPLPGQGIDRDQLPYGTQVVRRSALETAQSANLTDYLARRVPGAQVNDIQGSPFQGDLLYRGYRASGLIGASQGLSVYIDGVRVNEPFGDVVNWDMIPEFSVESMSLVPGANPAFGLNSLGGAIAFTTASGVSAPGVRAQVELGSFGRRSLDLSYGGANEDGWNWYAAAGGFEEDGWRDESAGHLHHFIGRLGRSFGSDEVSVNIFAGRSALIGNGLLPLYTVDEDGNRTPDIGAARREAVYTYPDETDNEVTQVSLHWNRDLDHGLRLETLAWLRHSNRTTISGDEADDDDDDEGAVDDDADEEDAEPNAAFNRTATRQRSVGASAALSGKQGGHQWQAGVSGEHARVRYEQTSQAANFDDSRGTIPAPDAADELSARVEGWSRTFGLYGTDTWNVAERTYLTGTVRFNHSRVSNQLDTVDDDSGELEVKPRETFSYRSVNPALGIAYQLDPGPTLFANVARNTRVPTVIELGCADPDEPCRLPAGLQADPYLKQVRSTTVEAGARYGRGGPTHASVSVYRTDNRDDILFSSVSVNGQLGYFRNFPKTRNQGFEAEWGTRWGAWTVDAGYSYLEATYQAEGTLRQGERNVTVKAGTRIAGLPKHQFKIGTDVALPQGWSLGADLMALSSRTIAGNEDGLLDDEATDEHRLDIPGYAVVNLRARWVLPQAKGVEVFAHVNNLFDREYASFGALAATQFDAAGTYTGEETPAVFVAPGAPRSFGVGVRARF